MQVYYGNAIRAHPRDLEGMVKACWAVFYHSLSTDERPRHHCCPKGAESWCKYQRALALHQDVPPHTPTIPADLEQYVKPVFDSLCEEKLLKRCLLGATQNQNESLNNNIWARAPKTEYASRTTIEVAVAQAVIVFNSGSQALAPIIGASRYDVHIMLIILAIMLSEIPVKTPIMLPLSQLEHTC